jgi:hypothetical protein
MSSSPSIARLCINALLRKHLKFSIRRLDVRMRRLEIRAGALAARPDECVVARMRLEGLAIRRARAAYLLQKSVRSTRQSRISRASARYRKHVRAV